MEDREAEEIQRAMRRVRSNLGNDVESLVQQARDATDWRCYVRRHPWFCMGAMAVAGYVCMPRGKPRASPIGSKEPAEEVADKAGVGAAGGIVSAVAGMVIRSAVTTLAQHGLTLLKHWRKSDADSVETASRPPHTGAHPAATNEAEPW